MQMASNQPIDELIEEIERRGRILIVEVIQLAEQMTKNRGNAYELANRAIVKLARKRRVEIGFRY